jgi:hypothetical protein
MDGLDELQAGGSRVVDAESLGATSLRELDPAWLRDNCECADCRDPVSGQRLISITDQPADVRLTSVADTPDGWHVRFDPDGHQTVFTRTWLDSQLTATANGRTEDAKRLWSAADFPGGPPAASWTDYLSSDATRLDCLQELLSVGFMLLRGVPAEPGVVLIVAATMGFVRETNYGLAGRIREVRYNSRSMQPMRPRRGGAPEKAALQMHEFYRAYRAFATILLRPDLTLRFSLEPGDCIVFDNTRILHSRTGFTATGHRHLQGCYADIDGPESTAAVLARRDAAVPAVSIDG